MPVGTTVGVGAGVGIAHAGDGDILLYTLMVGVILLLAVGMVGAMASTTAGVAMVGTVRGDGATATCMATTMVFMTVILPASTVVTTTMALIETPIITAQEQAQARVV